MTEPQTYHPQSNNTHNQFNYSTPRSGTNSYHVNEMVEADLSSKLKKTIGDYLSERVTKLEIPDLIDRPLWKQIKRSKQIKAEFDKNIDHFKQIVLSEFDSFLRVISETLLKCQSEYLTRLSNFKDDFDNYIENLHEDLETYADKARMLLDEEKGTLISEITSNAKDPWTNADLGSKTEIVPRACLDSDVERVYNKMIKIWENTTIMTKLESFPIISETSEEVLDHHQLCKILDSLGTNIVEVVNKETLEMSCLHDPLQIAERKFASSRTKGYYSPVLNKDVYEDGKRIRTETKHINDVNPSYEYISPRGKTRELKVR